MLVTSNTPIPSQLQESTLLLDDSLELLDELLEDELLEDELLLDELLELLEELLEDELLLDEELSLDELDEELVHWSHSSVPRNGP